MGRILNSENVSIVWDVRITYGWFHTQNKGSYHVFVLAVELVFVSNSYVPVH